MAASSINTAINIMSYINNPIAPTAMKKEAAIYYADEVGMDKANADGLAVLAEKGPAAMFAHMYESAGGDISRMYAMYH